jgi:cytochrome P450
MDTGTVSDARVAAERQGPQARPQVPPYSFRSRIPGANLVNLRRRPLTFLPELASRYGDVVRFHLGPQDVILLNDPELIREVLIVQDRRFSKGPGLRVAARLLGSGLLTSEGDFHRRQRRLAQPAFHRPRIAAYGEIMVQYAERCSGAWQSGGLIDMAEEMRALTLQIAARTLFDTEVEAEIEAISDALTESLRLYRLAMLPFAARLEPLAPMLTGRFKRARSRLDHTVYRMIRERRASGEDRGDLLSMLMLARDVDGDGNQMTDEQLRDEAMTLLLAGHETTANALAWTWYLLAQHPEVYARLEAELDQVLAGRSPIADDVPQLPYTRMVFAEAMRCYPPAWVVARMAIEDCPAGRHLIPKGTLVLMSEWVTHHDSRWYPDPYRFDPERWTPEATAARPRFAYYPFGGGSRVCIGEHFSWMEGVLVLAALASRWRFRLLPGQRIDPEPLITLRPRQAIRMTVKQR